MDRTKKIVGVGDKLKSCIMGYYFDIQHFLIINLETVQVKEPTGESVFM